MGSRFVKPETVTLNISRGDWLLVKKRLTAGEQRGIFRRMLTFTDGAPAPYMDPVQTGLSRIVAYLLDWSLTDHDGKKVEVSGKTDSEIASALNALDSESFKEILAAVESHEEAMDAELEAEKNSQGGGSGSSATSPSVNASAGDTKTS